MIIILFINHLLVEDENYSIKVTTEKGSNQDYQDVIVWVVNLRIIQNDVLTKYYCPIVSHTL